MKLHCRCLLTLPLGCQADRRLCRSDRRDVSRVSDRGPQGSSNGPWKPDDDEELRRIALVLSNGSLARFCLILIGPPQLLELPFQEVVERRVNRTGLVGGPMN